MITAADIELKKFDVAVHPATPRSTGCPST
jgi:hypothetical protein